MYLKILILKILIFNVCTLCTCTISHQRDVLTPLSEITALWKVLSRLSPRCKVHIYCSFNTYAKIDTNYSKTTKRFSIFLKLQVGAGGGEGYKYVHMV